MIWWEEDGEQAAVAVQLRTILLDRIEAEIVPATAEIARVARMVYTRFGKGRHRAKLNFGDCFAYALAKETGEPPPFKGDDFSKTDILAAA